tara:strand:- start:1541 stop:1732 length:192 start_codon:yes stop_codon:yes gene_type:complete
LGTKFVSEILDSYETEDVLMALKAAERMAIRFGEDMAVLHDLSVVALATNDEPALEIIRYTNE